MLIQSYISDDKTILLILPTNAHFGHWRADKLVTLRFLGITVSWDGVREIIIQLNSTWKGKVCGMCGNYNGKTKDDFTKRGGGITYTVNSFGNSWGYGSNEKTCVLEEDTEDACASNPSRHTWAKFACSMINTDVFKQCNNMVSMP